MPATAIAFDRFKPLQDEDCGERIVAAKAALGKRAVILGHHYQRADVYKHADLTGDSLQLSQAARRTEHRVICFAGVHFMAETAKILNPDRIVVVPDLDAGCSLADGITADDVRSLKQKYPGVPVVSYVNTNADVKAESDIICTSGNASRVVETLKTETVIFLPDEYLARNVAKETGRHIIFPSKGVPRTMDASLEYAMIGWTARCEVHEKFTVDDIKAVRKQFPDVVILAHPECSPEVVAASDFSGSTGAMIKYVEKTKAPRYLLLTECSMGDNIAAAQPEKEMLRMCSVRCPHMNEITLEDTLEALKKTQYVIEIPDEIRLRARKALDRMLAVN